MKTRILGRCCGLLWLLLSADLPALESVDSQRFEAFSEQMHKKNGFDAAAVRATLGQAKRLDSVLTAIARPAEYKPWFMYRPIFLTRERITGGINFWNEHAAALAKAEQEFGVPMSIIVAIIGVETSYGRNTGKYRVLDALTTLAFYYPPRADFFRSELENFLLLTRDEHLDPRLPTGSYAGAMGLPQFMPSSFRAWAVDFDHNGKRDIWGNPVDAIGSAANYLAQHGWQRNQPIALPVADAAVNATHVSEKVQLVRTVAQYRALGVRTLDAAPDDLSAVLLGYEDKTAKEYWLGFQNFYVITRYNRSPKYALAVVQLAEAIAAARATSTAGGSQTP